MTGSKHGLTPADRLLIFSAAFVARALILLWFNTTPIDIFRWSLDSWEYTAMAIAIAQGNWGFYMFGLRTPGYSLVLSGFTGLFGLSMPQAVAWLPFQIALTALSVLLGAHVIYRLTNSRQVAILGGLILAFDPMILGAEVPLLSEAIFIPALIASQLFLLRWLKGRRWRDFLICLVTLQIMVITRPSGLYLIVVILAAIILYNWRLWPYALLLLGGFCLPVIAWTARNNYYLGINTYSTAGVFNLLFYKDVSTEALVTGHSPDDIAWQYALEVETRVGDPSALDRRYFPTGNYTYLYVNNPARYKAMSDLAFEKLLQYNAWHLVKIPWHILEDFLKNETLKFLIPSWLQAAITAVSLLLFAGGLWRWLRGRHPLWQHVLVPGTIAYFMLTVSFLLAVPGTRFMSQLSVYWALMLALAVGAIYEWFAGRARGETGKMINGGGA
jgi:hypothetical protein